MNECIIGLCFLMFGGLGFQPECNMSDWKTSTYSCNEDIDNSFGIFNGELGIRFEIDDMVYVQGLHNSGINTSEGDWGANYLSFGVNMEYNHLQVDVGLGTQSKFENPTNRMSQYYFEGAAWWVFSNNMYLKGQHKIGIGEGSYSLFSFGWTGNLARGK